MSKPDNKSNKPKKDPVINSRKNGRAVALKYDQSSGAPIIIASGMGYMAEKMVEIAEDNGVPIYEDNSLATMLSQLQLGQQVPPELYQAIVQIYVYFLKFDPKDPNKYHREREERARLEKEQKALEAAQAKERAKEQAKEQKEEQSKAQDKTQSQGESVDEAMANLFGAE